MLHGPLHDAHTALDGSIDDLTAPLPVGFATDIVRGFLNLPGVLVVTLEHIVLGFGS